MLNNSKGIDRISKRAVDNTNWSTFEPAGDIETWDWLFFLIKNTALIMWHCACPRVKGNALDGLRFVANALNQEVAGDFCESLWVIGHWSLVSGRALQAHTL